MAPSKKRVIDQINFQQWLINIYSRTETPPEVITKCENQIEMLQCSLRPKKNSELNENGYGE